MTSLETSPQRWTWAAFREGAVGILPLLPGLIAFGIAFGTVAARKGFTLFESMLMSATVFAGMSQMIVLETWPERLTLPAIAAAALITGMVGLRFLLIGASLRPWLHTSSGWKVYPSLYLLTEPNWLLSMRYHSAGGADPAFLLGSGAMTWVAWVLSVVPGFWLGAIVSDPKMFGLDVVMPAFFIAMLVSLWRGPRRAIAWVVAAGVAIASDWLFGGFWFVLTGAMAGSVAGGMLDDRE
jgi:predicted branched-subunit amino acid permease